MRGKPKTGEVWTVEAMPDEGKVWRYQILAAIQHQGRTYYAAAKDSGLRDEPWVMLFDDAGLETGAHEGTFRLISRSRAKPLFPS